MSSDPIEHTITETTEADLGFVIDAGSDADAEELRREIDAAAREETTQP